MPLNVVVLLVALVGATLFGFGIRRYNGYFRGAARADDEAVAVARDHEAAREALRREDVPGGEFGETATLLQFSSAFCAPCRVTRRILGEVAALVPGVTHVEIDAEHHLELVRRLGVRRTPTTFVLDAAGGIVSRASGPPTKAAVIAALGRVVE